MVLDLAHGSITYFNTIMRVNPFYEHIPLKMAFQSEFISMGRDKLNLESCKSSFFFIRVTKFCIRVTKPDAKTSCSSFGVGGSFVGHLIGRSWGLTNIRFCS